MGLRAVQALAASAVVDADGVGRRDADRQHSPPPTLNIPAAVGQVFGVGAHTAGPGQYRVPPRFPL